MLCGLVEVLNEGIFYYICWLEVLVSGYWLFWGLGMGNIKVNEYWEVELLLLFMWFGENDCSGFEVFICVK